MSVAIYLRILTMSVLVVCTSSCASTRGYRSGNDYVIDRKVNLKGGTLTIPEGCNLVFKGKGKILNGTVVGQRTSIVAEKRLIMENVSIAREGTWNTERSYPEWFGTCEKPSYDSKMAIQKAIDVADTCVLSQKYYTSYDTPTGRGDDAKVCAIAVKNKCIKGLPGSKLLIDAKYSNTERTTVFWVGDNVTIDGVNIEYLNEDHSGWTGIQAGVYRVQGGNVKIENTMLRGAMAAWINLIGQPGRENYTVKNNYVHDCDCGLIIQGSQHIPGEVYSIKLLMADNVIEKEKERHSEFVSFWGECKGEGLFYYTDITIRNNNFSGGYRGGCISGHPKHNGLKNVIIEGNEFYDCGACSFYNADGLMYKNNHVTGTTFIERQINGTMGSYPDLALYNCSNCTIDDCSCFGLTIKDCKMLHIGKIKQTLSLPESDTFLTQKDYVTNFIGINADNSTVTIDSLVISPYKDESRSTEICTYYVYRGGNSKIKINVISSSIPVLVTKNSFETKAIEFKGGLNKEKYRNVVR